MRGSNIISFGRRQFKYFPAIINSEDQKNEKKKKEKVWKLKGNAQKTYAFGK